MFRIAICDDEPPFIRDLSGLLDDVLREDQIMYSLDTFTDTSSLVNAITKNERVYHILLLDIMMGLDNGIDMAKHLRELEIRSSIIFVSSRGQFAIDSFAASPANFLTKPVQRDKLQTALRQCLKIWETDAFVSFANADGNIHMAKLGDILFAEIFNIELLVHLANGTIITCTGKLEDVLELLPSSRFYRCHRSYVVNLGGVTSIGKQDYILTNGEIIPIARRKYNEALRALAKYKGMII